MYINGYFIILFDLTPDLGASEGHTSHPEQGSIRVVLKFNKPLHEAITCQRYLEFDNSFLMNSARNVRTDFQMDNVQILFKLRNVKSFLDVYASDLLQRSIMKTCTFFANADLHTEGGSQSLAIHFRTKSSGAYYFDSYGILLFVPDIQAFLRRNCTTWDHNGRQLQGLTSDVCGKYCCLFALYMDRG